MYAPPDMTPLYNSAVNAICDYSPLKISRLEVERHLSNRISSVRGEMGAGCHTDISALRYIIQKDENLRPHLSWRFK